MKKELLIGDCHFGIKSNSTEWLRQQTDYFDTEVVSTIRDNGIERVIFLGDLSDVRYSINQQVGIELKELIKRIVEKFPSVEFIFLAGNHDFYSPLEEFAHFNSYELLFDDEFMKLHKNVTFITEEPKLIDDELYLPWFWTENPDHFDDMVYRFDLKHEVKCIFCHADLTVWPAGRIASLYGSPVYAGHIHYIVDDPIGNLHNVGALFPLTFNDVNQTRYMYILEDHKVVEKIANTKTFQFRRLFNEEIFTATEDVFNNAYVELWVSDTNSKSARYIEQIKTLKSTYLNSNIRVHVIDDDEDISKLETAGSFDTNIGQYIEENIPSNLRSRYEEIKKIITEKA